MRRGRGTRSVRYAVGVAAVYGIVAASYILISSTMAADASRTVDDLRRLETLKGFAFVTVTSALVFAGAFAALRRMERDGEALLRRERALVEAEGRVFSGLIAATVAHDANNVLMAVLAELDELDASAGTDERTARLRQAVTQLVELNRRLANASRVGSARDLRTTDLVGIARDSVTALRAHATIRRCTVRFAGDGSFSAPTNPLLVHQALSNLILNAGEATGGQGTIEVTVAHDKQRARIEVHDNGPGVPPERRAGLFDALTTTKPNGTGLGLFSVRACAAALGGHVDVGDSPLGGACFGIVLPLDRNALQQDPA